MSDNELFKGLLFIIMIPIVFIGAILLMALWGLVWSFPLTWAWNYVVPTIFGLPTITYWQMFALYFVLTSLWKVTVTTYSK